MAGLGPEPKEIDMIVSFHVDVPWASPSDTIEVAAHKLRQMLNGFTENPNTHPDVRIVVDEFKSREDHNAFS